MTRGPLGTLDDPAPRKTVSLVFGTPIRIDYTKFVHLLGQIRGILAYYEINTVSFQGLTAPPRPPAGIYAPLKTCSAPLEEKSWRRPWPRGAIIPGPENPLSGPGDNCTFH